MKLHSKFKQPQEELHEFWLKHFQTKCPYNEKLTFYTGGPVDLKAFPVPSTKKLGTIDQQKYESPLKASIRPKKKVSTDDVDIGVLRWPGNMKSNKMKPVKTIDKHNNRRKKLVSNNGNTQKPILNAIVYMRLFSNI